MTTRPGPPPVDMTGKVVGQLTVVKLDVGRHSQGRFGAYWHVRCVCGKRFSARADWLRRGANSCGCSNSKRRTKAELRAAQKS